MNPTVEQMRRAIAEAAQSAGMKAPVVNKNDMTTVHDMHASMGDKIRQRAADMQNMIESTPFKYEAGQHVFTKLGAKNNRPPMKIIRRVMVGNNPMREDHPKLEPGNGMGRPIKDPVTGKTMRTPHEPGYHVRQEDGENWHEYHIPESAIVSHLAAGGHLTHTPKSPNPDVGTRYEVSEATGLAPKTPVDLEQHKGASIMVMPWDSTSRNVKVRSVSGRQLPDEVTTHGGQDYARDLEHMRQAIAGASGEGIAKRIATREAIARMQNEEQGGTGRILHLPITMGERGEDFSMPPTEILHQLYRMAELPKGETDRMNAEIRAHKIIKSGKTIQPFGGFVGLEHPEFHEQIERGHGLDTTPGELRKAIVDRLGYLKANQKALGFNMEDVVGAVTDPALRGVPKGFIGNTVIGSDPEQMTLTPSSNKAYDTNFSGEYLGSLGHSFPAEVLMGKHIERLRNDFAKKRGDTRTMALGALEKRKFNVSQLLDNETLDHYGDFLRKRAQWAKTGHYAEGGNVEPSQDEMLAHIMLHKADGGAVNIKEVGVDEAPDMPIKEFVPPAGGGGLPPGGVDFEPLTPGNQLMPTQPGQQPGQPPQGQAPGQPQQGPLGQPQSGGPLGQPQSGGPLGQSQSNILSMTPQGQALQAMRPSRLAKGGKVKRNIVKIDWPT